MLSQPDRILAEAHDFDADRAEEWIREFENYYDVVRGLTKALALALNGIAAGSAFQVALLADIRVAHPGVRMGQPEINCRKAPLAMRLNKAWLREMTEAGFRASIDAAIRAHRRSYASGEPARKIDEFFAHRAGNTVG